VRRNKARACSAAAISVSLIAGLSGALWQAHVARAQAERAEQVKEFALSIFDCADTDSGAGSATTAADLAEGPRGSASRANSRPPRTGDRADDRHRLQHAWSGQTADAHALMHDAVECRRNSWAAALAHDRALAVYGEALVGLGQNAKAIAVLAPASSGAE